MLAASEAAAARALHLDLLRGRRGPAPSSPRFLPSSCPKEKDLITCHLLQCCAAACPLPSPFTLQLSLLFNFTAPPRTGQRRDRERETLLMIRSPAAGAASGGRPVEGPRSGRVSGRARCTHRAHRARMAAVCGCGSGFPRQVDWESRGHGCTTGRAAGGGPARAERRGAARGRSTRPLRGVHVARRPGPPQHPPLSKYGKLLTMFTNNRLCFSSAFLFCFTTVNSGDGKERAGAEIVHARAR